jgi:hypothetical protein
LLGQLKDDPSHQMRLTSFDFYGLEDNCLLDNETVIKMVLPMPLWVMFDGHF